MINQNYKINSNYAVLILSILSFIYIFITNNYFSIEESFIFGGGDGYSYLEIAKSSPYITEVSLQPIHTERFVVPYLIGFINKLILVDNYIIFRFLTIFCLLTINYYLIKILFLCNLSLVNILFSILLINLNPYITRFYIANPLIINDLVFHIGVLLCVFSFFEKKKKYFFLGLIISIIARQSAVAILLSIIFLNVIKKGKSFYNKKDIFFSFIIILFIYLLGYLYSSNTLQDDTRYNQYYTTVFGIFLENKSFNELLLFFIWPFLSFGPLILYLFLYLKSEKIKTEKNTDLNYFILFFSALIILQPILQGLEVSGRNIIRLSNFAFIPLLILAQINFVNIKKNILIKNIFFIIILFIWSSHPTYSIFSFLENYKF